jgi:hypothetical protein
VDSRLTKRFGRLRKDNPVLYAGVTLRKDVLNA